MKSLKAALPLPLIVRAFAGDASVDAATPAEPPAARVNANNASLHAHRLQSYANGDRTKTVRACEGSSEDASRQAAALIQLPVDSITEVPVDLTS